MLLVLAMRPPFVPDHFHFASETTVGVIPYRYEGHDNDCSVRRSEHSFVATTLSVFDPTLRDVTYGTTFAIELCQSMP